MTLTERVYTHLDVRVLIDAINKIAGERENGRVYTHLDVRVLIDAINKIAGERENGKEEK